MRRPVVMTLIALLASSALFAGTPQQPTAGVPGVPAPGAPLPGGTPAGDRDTLQNGTATIRGRVVALDTGLPLRMAQVSLSAVGTSRPHLILTDDQGRFEFDELPAAQYVITAAKQGYIALSYGQRQPSDSRRPLALSEGARVDDVTFRLPRGGVIAGHVVDEYGEPVVRARVEALRRVDGQTPPASRRSGPETDDHGAFRIFDLVPGDYVVQAWLEQRLGTPTEEIDLRTVYLPTYYPGTTDAASARQVTVGAGEEVAGLVVPLVVARAATISGRVVDASGRPYPQAQLSLVEGTFSRAFDLSGPDGTFTVTGVAPGEYRVVAAGALTGAAGVAGRDEGAVEIVVGGEDITGLVIAATAGVTARGRIVSADGRPPQRLETSQVSLATLVIPSGNISRAGVTIADDWTFQIEHLRGQRLLRLTTPPDWTVRGILHQGRDVTDTPLDFSRVGIDGLVIELTQDLTSLTGAVRDARGAPVPDALVVLFPDDPDRWAMPSRFIRTMRTDQSGSFQTRGLPPGAYLAVALDYLESTSPAALEQISRSGQATRVLLREGQSSTIELRMNETF